MTAVLETSVEGVGVRLEHVVAATSGERPGPRRVVVVGAGMAAARLVEELRAGQPDPQQLAVTVLGAEAEAPYNRIMLSHAVAGAGRQAGGPAVAALKPPGWWERNQVDLRTSTAVVRIDREAREVELADGARVGYDHLVLATGAAPRIPAIEGLLADASDATAAAGGGRLSRGAFLLREAAHQRELSAHLAAHPGPIAVIGGGFIGLEVACALAGAGHEVVVVHPRGWPMNGVLDAGAGAALIRALAALGVRVVTGARARRWDGSVLSLDDDEVRCRTVLLTAGSAPRTGLAMEAGLDVAGGVVVDDTLTTSDPMISAIGDCAEHRGVVSGLVAPAWEQAVGLAARLTGSDPSARYRGGATVTRLKASGLDVVSLGRLAADPVAAADDGVECTTISEPARGRYARVDVRDGRVVGAVLVGHPEPVGMLTQLYENGLPVPDDVVSVILGRAETVAAETPATMPAAAVVCRCNGVSKKDLVEAWAQGARERDAIAETTRAGTGCGGCSSAVEGICGWLREAG